MNTALRNPRQLATLSDGDGGESAKQSLPQETRAQIGRLADARLRRGSRLTKVDDLDLVPPNAERLREIRHRIEAGFYNREDVKGLIADQIIDDLFLSAG